MQLTMGNLTLREEMIDWVPCPKGRRKAKKHLALAFDLKSPCGDLWVNAAYIHEPMSMNPGLNIVNDSQTSGVASIQRMLILLEEWRARKAIPPSHADRCLAEVIE